jgi:tetratricopeptide (TPR) repeat protein/TolB-like protein
MEDRELLHSWKEISDHLGCSLRTCHRWEEELDLPVHRLDGTPKARVFAYADELDAWLQGKLNHIGEAAEPEDGDRGRKRTLAVLAVVVTVVLTAAAALIWRPFSPAPPPAIKPILALLPFENLSGTADLDWLCMGLPELVTTDLFQSRYLDVMAGDRVYGVLKELKMVEPRKYSQEDLARIAKRAAVDHLGTGNFMKLGEDIIVTFSLRHMPDGKLISSRRVTCAGLAGTGDGIDELTRQIKADLGLDSRQFAADADKRIGQITSRSPEALEYYLEGRRKWRTGSAEEIRSLMRKAIEIDPQFAMAYRDLGLRQFDSGEDYASQERLADMARYLKKALELSDRVSERERYVIQAAYFRNVEKDVDKELQAYKDLLKIYPDDYLGNSNIIIIYHARADYANALKHCEFLYERDKTSRQLTLQLAGIYRRVGAVEKALEVYRYYFENQWNGDLPLRQAYCDALWRSGDFKAALKEADAIERLDPTEKVERIFPLYLMGNYPAAEKLCEAALLLEPAKGHWTARDWLQNIYVTQGQFEKAKEQIALGLKEQVSASDADPRGRAFLLRRRAVISLIEGDLSAAMADVESVWDASRTRDDASKGPVSLEWPALMTIIDIWLAMGRPDEARNEFRRIGDLIRERSVEYRRLVPERSGAEAAIRKEKSYLDLVQGKIELKKGRVSKAIGLLRQAQFPYFDDASRPIPPSQYMEALALAYEQAGMLSQARDEYEKILRLTGSRLFEGYTYAMSLYRLGKICERQGDRPKTVEYYGKFAELWKNADRIRPELEDARARLAGIVAPEAQKAGPPRPALSERKTGPGGGGVR